MKDAARRDDVVHGYVAQGNWTKVCLYIRDGGCVSTKWVHYMRGSNHVTCLLCAVRLRYVV